MRGQVNFQLLVILLPPSSQLSSFIFPSTSRQPITRLNCTLVNQTQRIGRPRTGRLSSITTQSVSEILLLLLNSVFNHAKVSLGISQLLVASERGSSKTIVSGVTSLVRLINFARFSHEARHFLGTRQEVPLEGDFTGPSICGIC